MKISFKNKVVLVTGSTRNIGKCIVENFAQNDAIVIINSRHQADILNTLKEFRKKGYQCFGIAADVSQPKKVQEMINKITNRYKKINILVNNAAVWYSSLAENINEQMWKKVLTVNLTGTFNCCKAVFPIMQRQGGGKIINIGSDSVKGGTLIADVSLVSSKFGVLGLTRQLANEWGPYHININTVSVSLVDDLNRYKRDAKYREAQRKALKMTPLGRLVKPQDIANLVLFLSSEKADFITGQTISVNGGLIFN